MLLHRCLPLAAMQAATRSSREVCRQQQHEQEVRVLFRQQLSPFTMFTVSPFHAGGSYSPGAPAAMEHGSTLDEPLWQTILRDVKRIWANLVLVVFPFKNRDQQSSALRNWDLWGPMVSNHTDHSCCWGAPMPAKLHALHC